MRGAYRVRKHRVGEVKVEQHRGEVVLYLSELIF